MSDSTLSTLSTRALPLPATAVLVHTPHCTVRAQREQHLVYNSRSDELHLIPPTGIYVYELCDGLATVGDIEAALALATGRDSGEIRPDLTRYLSMLIARGLLAISTTE